MTIINDLTTNLGLPLPNAANVLLDDVARLRTALQGIDTALHAGDVAQAGSELLVHKGAVNGYAGLDGLGKVPVANLPVADVSGTVNKSGDTMTGALNSAAPVTLASAGTMAIGAAASNVLKTSGAVTITAFDTIAAGAVRTITFGGASVITHNATSLILPGGANITAAAGDVFTFESLGSGNWRCTGFSLASGINVAGTLSVAKGGTGATTLTGLVKGNGSGALSTAAAGTDYVAPGGALGTPSSGTATNLTGLPVSTGLSGLGTNVAAFLATPSSANLAAALTDETGTGANVFATSPAITTPTITGTPATTGGSRGYDATALVPTFYNGSAVMQMGYLNVPQNSQSVAYTAVITDAGKHILHPTADTTARTFTIPANSSVAFPVGTALTFVNQASAGVVTIAITTDTMRLAGAGTTGSRTLAANGVATAIKLTSTEWIISGTGLT